MMARKKMVDPGMISPEGMAALTEILDLCRSRDGESERSFKKRQARTVGELRAEREGGDAYPVLGLASLNRELLNICFARRRESAKAHAKREAATWAKLKRQRVAAGWDDD
jgi:hypothetical protein